jgi:hypothetical protein
MIICIDVSQRTKDELERLLEAGKYRDYSEAVAVAIANQLLLHNHAAGNPVKVTTPDVVLKGQPVEEKVGRTPSGEAIEKLKVPSMFSSLGHVPEAPRFAPYPNDLFIIGQEVPVDRWIFGQHNKLLPVKASCRALARLMSVGGNLSLAKTASEIASEAVKLGDYLRHLDEASGVHRDDALSFAFPYSNSPNGDKSRLRYANQFVASFTKQGTLAGLPVELKLVNRDHSRTPHLLLTEAGWRFAEMQNPILDDGKDARQSKFADNEIDFLLTHIRSRVPAEAFAYRAVIDAISDGANTPDKLDDALDKYLPKRNEKPFTRAFLTTQRAGVISRMVDLGLVQRIRDGTNVTYASTAKSFESSPTPVSEAV